MKIIITESQLLEIERTLTRDRFDADYEDEYPKYKDIFFNAIKMDITSSGETEERIMLGDLNGTVFLNYRKGSRTLYYDYDWAEDIEKLIPWYIYARHFKYALAEWFNNLFPNVSIKDVTGAHVS